MILKMIITQLTVVFLCTLGWTSGISIRTRLCDAAADNDEGAVKTFLQEGDDASEYCTAFEMLTPLDIAATWGYYGVGKALLDGGANVDSPGGLGYTPSLHAAENVRGKFLRLLLANGASIDVEIMSANLMSKAAIGYMDNYSLTFDDAEKVKLKRSFFEAVDALHEFCFDLAADGAFAYKRLSGENYDEEAEYLALKSNEAQPDRCYENLNGDED